MNKQSVERSKPFIRYPKNKLFAVINESQALKTALNALADIGIDANDIEIFCGEAGIKRIDAEGREHSLRTRIIRTVQQLGQEGADVKRYKQELEAGHYLISVFTPEDVLKTKVIEVLKTHSAHQISFYAALNTEKY